MIAVLKIIIDYQRCSRVVRDPRDAEGKAQIGDGPGDCPSFLMVSQDPLAVDSLRSWKQMNTDLLLLLLRMPSAY